MSSIPMKRLEMMPLPAEYRKTTAEETGLAGTSCPPSTQFAAYNKITAAKELMVYHE
ncbi:acetylxylan esterase [Paenibacillus sp. FSL K6-1217]|uniref:acetylxylan esterase n=1 Tax=Paenibacillus sp. FSL K6-1217 TaxID=2921466 RepID=UPI003866B74F